MKNYTVPLALIGTALLLAGSSSKKGSSGSGGGAVLPADPDPQEMDCLLDFGSSTTPPDDATLDSLIGDYRPGTSLGFYGGAFGSGEWYSIVSGKSSKLNDHVFWLVGHDTLVKSFLRAAALTAILALDDRVYGAGWPTTPPGECWSPKTAPPGFTRVEWAALQVANATMRAIVTGGGGLKNVTPELKGTYQAAAGANYGAWYGLPLAQAAAGWSQATWPGPKMGPNYPAPFAPDGAGGPDASGVGGAPTVRILQLVSSLMLDFLQRFFAATLD